MRARRAGRGGRRAAARRPLHAPRRVHRRGSRLFELPEFVVAEVLSFVGVRDLCRLRCAGRAAAVADADPVWRARLQRLQQRGGRPRRDSDPAADAADSCKRRVRLLLLQRAKRGGAGAAKRIRELRRRDPCSAAQRGAQLLALEFSAEVNGEPAPVLASRGAADRRASWTGASNRVAGVSAAAGARYFASTAVVRLAVPAGLRAAALRSVVVRATAAKLGRRTRDALSVDTSAAAAAWRAPAAGPSEHGLRLHEFADGGSSLVVGEWGAAGDLALLQATIHLSDAVVRLAAGALRREPVFDDVDRSYGLHGLAVVVTLRTLGVVCWEGAFANVDAGSVGGGFADFELVREEGCAADPSRHFEREPELRVQTAAFSSRVAGAVVVDALVRDEHGEPMWAFSRVLSLAGSASASFSYEMEQHGDVLRGVVAEPPGELVVTCARVAPIGAFADGSRAFDYGAGEAVTALLGLRLRLALPFVNEWCGTSYR